MKSSQSPKIDEVSLKDQIKGVHLKEDAKAYEESSQAKECPKEDLQAFGESSALKETSKEEEAKHPVLKIQPDLNQGERALHGQAELHDQPVNHGQPVDREQRVLDGQPLVR